MFFSQSAFNNRFVFPLNSFRGNKSIVMDGKQGLWLRSMRKTKTATKQRTKEAVNVTIQGNDTEPVTSKNTKSCLVKTARVRKNKTLFNEKEISTKAETNSVRFPVLFISNNQTRTEGRATRNHAFRTIEQMAAGMTNSLRTLYFDFQNKDENNCKPEKRNDRIKVGAKLRPNQHGGHIHKRKLFVTKTVLNTVEFDRQLSATGL